MWLFLYECGESLTSNKKFSGSTFKRKVSQQKQHFFSGAGTLVLLDSLQYLFFLLMLLY